MRVRRCGNVSPLLDAGCGSGSDWSQFPLRDSGCESGGMLSVGTRGTIRAEPCFDPFGWETGHMLQDGEWTKAAIYVGVSVVAGIILMLGGIHLGDALS